MEETTIQYKDLLGDRTNNVEVYCDLKVPDKETEESISSVDTEEGE